MVVRTRRVHLRPAPSAEVTGTAFEDARNPIRQLFHGERLDLWSLQPVKVEGGVSAPDDSTPERGTGFGDQSPDMIDQFVEQRLTAAGLAPSAPADRRTLVRRVTFDLTGLPPGPAEVNAFVDDASPNAYVNLVERLLASPAYGERQARLWLDVVRYADTNGYERDEFRPLIWMYRDYVVRSFNADKAFDQFIREQLAGDELAAGPPRTPAEVDALMATGYLRLGQWDSTASIFQEEDRLRDEVMADLTNTTASAFLGLTMSCCQCHDHKYDPLSQADHYRLRAFFAGVIPRDELIVELPDKLQEIEQHNAQLNQQIEPLRAEQAQLNKEQEPGKTRHEELARQIAALESQLMRPLFAMGATEVGASAPATYVLYQGVYRDPRDEVLPGFPSVLYPGPALIEPTQNGTSGRRLALANWIASSNNPWTARVIVNRIWQQHFVAGLVASPNDFGVTGERPTHPELLDWLAATFVDDGWSIKRLHRAIVLSRAYQRASLQAGPAVQIDPENHLLWRQNVQRLDAETLRDSLLAVSGLLKPSSGGKPRWPEVPDELLHAQPAILEAIEGKDGGRRQGWYTDPLEETDVRSLYLVRKRCLPIPLLQVFDLPDTTVSCARRETTVVAPQALMLLNSPSALRYAEAFANRVWLLGDRPGEPDRPEPDLARLVKIAFRLGLARDPDSEELALAQDFLQQHAEQHRAAGRDPEVDRLALVDLCRAIFNLNEFCYVD